MHKHVLAYSIKAVFLLFECKTLLFEKLQMFEEH